MKKLVLLVVVLCSVLLSGCFLKSTIKITDEESKVIAESAAQLLLKYDKNYSEKLINPEDALELTITPSGTVTQSPTATQTDQNNASVSAAATPTVTPTDPPDTVTTVDSTNLLKFTGNENITMQCTDYKMYENYEVSNSVNIEPLTIGNQLMVVNIQLTNTSKEIQKVNIFEAGLSFQLETDNGKQYAPSQSILLNDLQYLGINITAESIEEAVLIFEVSSDFSADKMYLSVRKDTETIFLKLN